MKYKLFILLLVWQVGAFAAVNIADNRKAPESKQKRNVPLTKKKAPRVKNKIHQLEIEGYADSVYVRFVVEISNKKVIAGQMFQDTGGPTYVYGENLDGVLHLYGEKGEHFTVIVP